MSGTLTGSRYAKALFELAKKESLLPEIEALLSSLVKLTGEHPGVMSIIQTPTLKESEKSSFVEKMIPADSPALLKDFLKVLLEKKRFAALGEIRDEFHQMFEKDQGILEVEVVSVIPFSKTVLEKIKSLFTARLRSGPPSRLPGWIRPPTEVRLVPKTDTSLLGGFVLRFSDREIDCSFKNRLHEIEQQLITQ